MCVLALLCFFLIRRKSISISRGNEKHSICIFTHTHISWLFHACIYNVTYYRRKKAQCHGQRICNYKQCRHSYQHWMNTVSSCFNQGLTIALNTLAVNPKSLEGQMSATNFFLFFFFTKYFVKEYVRYQ